MKVLITGAHFTPAQAVIEELQKNPDTQIIYVGRKNTIEGDKTLSVESQVLPELGVKFIPIVTGRLRRYFSIGTFISLFKIPIGFIQAFFILISEKPDVILSFGGYVAVPVVFWGWLFSVPILVHEQTLVTGLANRISNIFADKIAVSFDTDYSFKKEKLILTGNPIRKELLEIKGQPSKEITELINIKKRTKLPLIFITGGNQGSHHINETVLESLNELLAYSVVIHQTGDSKFKDFDIINSRKDGLKNKERYLAAKWFNAVDIAFIFKNADLVISRGGANTLTELAYFAIPTIVIPIDFLYKDEQNKNALFFNKLGLNEIIKEKDLNPRLLIQMVKNILKDLSSFKTRALGARDIAKKDAAKRLALELMLVDQRHVQVQ